MNKRRVDESAPQNQDPKLVKHERKAGRPRKLPSSATEVEPQPGCSKDVESQPGCSKNIEIDKQDISLNVAEPVHRIFLNTEILIHMFQYLPLEDRKNVRLTCSLWNELSQISSITKNEKFVFRDNNTHEDIMETLENSKATKVNIEFQCLHINLLPPSLWTMYGHRIQSINLSLCDVSYEAFKDVLITCTNLVSFSMGELDSWQSSSSPASIPSSFDRVLDHFIRKGERFMQLRSLNLRFKYYLRNLGQLLKIFEVFPNLNSLDAGHWSPLSRIDTNHFFPPNYLQQLERVISHSNGLEGFWLHRIPATKSKLKKFGTFLSGIPYSNSLIEPIFNFFLDQGDLEVIHLKIHYSLNSSFKPLLLLILVNCTKLRRFSFFTFVHFDICFTWAEAEIFLFQISKLQYFATNCHFSIESSSLSSIPDINLALKELSISIPLKSTQNKREINTLILRQCTELNHLELFRATNDTLQDIIKWMPNLSSLTLTRIDRCTVYGFAGQEDVSSKHTGLSIGSLKGLEYLEIRDELGPPILGSLPVPERKLAEFFDKIAIECRFAHLKYLKLTVGYQIPCEILWKFTSNSPAIETLKLEQQTFKTLEEVVRVCCHLKNLKFLNVHTLQFVPEYNFTENLQEEWIQPVFGACLNLRYISTRKTMYLINIFTKKITININLFYGCYSFPGKKYTLQKKKRNPLYKPFYELL